MNELDSYIKKTNWYLYNEYFIEIRGAVGENNVMFNWYFESFSKNQTFQECAGRIAKYLKLGVEK